MNDETTQRVLAKISEAIVETVNEAPNGAPCGPLYMALMHVWPSMTSLQFNMLIATLVAAGKVTRVGHVLYMNTNQSCNAADEYNADLRLRIRDKQVGSGMKHRP